MKGVSSVKTFNWCFIGAGTIAFKSAEVITKSGRHKVVSIWNRTQSKATDFKIKFGATVYDTAREAITDPNVDGVYVCVTHHKHMEYSLLALKYHKPVLCEKTFAVNYHQANRIIEYAKIQNTYIVEAMWTWFAPTALAIKKLIGTNILGNIKNVDVTFSIPMLDYDNSPRRTDINQCGGALLDFGMYAITYCYNLFGRPKKVSCSGVVERGVDISEVIVFDYDSFSCTMDISMRDNKGSNFIVHGSEKSVHIPWFHMAKGYAYGDDIETITKLQQNYMHNNDLYIHQFDTVAREILNGQINSLVVPHKHTLDVLKLLDECRKQLQVVYPYDLLD